MRIKDWINAARLRTLPLAIANMAMGNGLAALQGMFDWWICILSILTALTLQVLSNFANDYGDSIHGADNDSRQGPQRSVQTGVISSQQMKTAIIIMGILSFILGTCLLFAALEDPMLIGSFLALGLVSIWAAYNYTAGDNPYGYAGLGDISVFIFFGLAAVLGCYFLQTKTIDYEVILPAITCGLLSVGVLNVNNIRDIESDITAGKRSIPVIIGKSAAILYHGMLLLIAWSALIGFTLISEGTPWRWAASSPQEIDPYLKQLALSTTLLVILFLTGHLIF